MLLPAEYYFIQLPVQSFFHSPIYSSVGLFVNGRQAKRKRINVIAPNSFLCTNMKMFLFLFFFFLCFIKTPYLMSLKHFMDIKVCTTTELMKYLDFECVQVYRVV